ncbi:hypothetical protein INR49_027734 [Caranx melampygus]|nr:hypothetical protein INR49_027734 [Caranx melampygus]
MIKEHGDLFSDSQCKVCSAVLISESQKLTHYQVKQETRQQSAAISFNPEREGASAQKLKTSSSDSSHYQGKVHAKNLRLKTVGPQTPAVACQTAPTVQPKKKPTDDPSSAPAVGNNNNNSNNNNNPDRFCSICQASFNNPLMAQQHYVGKKHRKQMTKLKLMETYGPSTAPASTLKGYPCTICNIELNSVEQYQSHISGAKHKNQMKKSGVNTTEHQHAPEQSYGADKHFTGGDDQYTAADDQYAPGDDQYTAGETSTLRRTQSIQRSTSTLEAGLGWTAEGSVRTWNDTTTTTTTSPFNTLTNHQHPWSHSSVGTQSSVPQV